MTGPDPSEYGWWLASRASGVLALLCVAISVGVGLAMAGRVAADARLARTLMALHRQTALVGLVGVAVHGITLLGDRHLDPGITGIAVPFVIDHAPLWTGLGVTGGWLAAILGLSWYARDRIGAQRWRGLHKATLLVYVLSVAHTLGSGTDASEPWLRLLLVATGAPILFLFVVRILPPAAAPSDRRTFHIADVRPESATVTSLALEPVDGKPLAPFAPGQFLTVTLDGVTRSYSLSAAPDPRRYRISVKREEQGACSARLHAAEAGDTLEVTGPFGAFMLDADADRPVVLVSAGIGATPVLAMLEALARERSPRPVRWIHQARNGREHAFREEVRELVGRLPDGRIHVRYSQPDARDVEGRDFDVAGRLSADTLAVPDDADVYVCGTTAFVASVTAGLPPERTRTESFTPAPAPRPPAVRFDRSDVEVDWDDRFASLLELAEAHDVPAQSGCRVGACHGCKAAVVAGRTTHEVEGGALICCAKPREDVVLDL